jgi:SAM-dependent methyltransferase
MNIWCDTRAAFGELERVMVHARALVEPDLLARRTAPAWCSACGTVREMRVSAGDGAEPWRNLLEGMICPCGLNGRMRLMLGLIDEVTRRHDVSRCATFERLTPMFGFMQQRLPGLVGSEYLGEEVRGGETRMVRGTSVRHENIMASSYADASLDLVIHCDVLEHVPDAQAALRDNARILAPGGTMLFSLPFYHTLDRHLVRARLGAGGIEHLMPEVFHGNPVTQGGALVFIHPGWELFDQLRAAGFAHTWIVARYDPVHGIVSNGCPYRDGHMWPVAIAARHQPLQSTRRGS